MNRNMAKEWLLAARDDLMAIEELSDNVLLTHISSFHAHQALEKSLKAVIEYNQKKVPKTHDLVLLISEIPEFFNDYDQDTIDVLNKLYVDSRYPGDMGLLPNGKPSAEDVSLFHTFAYDIFNTACEITNIDIKKIVG